MDKINLFNFINKKLEEAMKDSSFTSKEYLLIKSAYLAVVNFVNEQETTLTQLSESVEYEVDYSCPARNGFIETVEKSV